MEPANETPKQEAVPGKVTMEQVTVLRKCISDTIMSYRHKRNKNKFGAISIQILSIVLSFGTTVLIGWKLSQDTSGATGSILTGNMLTNSALIVSALATGMNALDKFFDYKALWIGYNISIASLKSIRSKLSYITSVSIETIKQSDLDRLFDQYEQICANMNSSYDKIRSSRDE